jgi:hypothetical protein
MISQTENNSIPDNPGAYGSGVIIMPYSSVG